jgi:hypothetical protein
MGERSDEEMKSKFFTAIVIALFLASMLSMSFIAPVAATPDGGIVGYWNFDEGAHKC